MYAMMMQNFVKVNVAKQLVRDTRSLTSWETITFNFGYEDFLVFYPNCIEDYDRIISSLNKNAIKRRPTKNPYWNENGKLFFDPDGYGIIISNLKTQA